VKRGYFTAMLRKLDSGKKKKGTRGGGLSVRGGGSMEIQKQKKKGVRRKDAGGAGD